MRDENEFDEDDELDEEDWERPEWEEEIVNKTADLLLKFFHDQPSMPGFPEPRIFRNAFDSAFNFAMGEIMERHNDEVDRHKKASMEYLTSQFLKMQRHNDN